MDENETSESGMPIYRYDEAKENEFEFAPGGDHIEDISGHIEHHVGPIDMVFHELISDQVHIDVHWVKPTDERPFHTLVTSGMSDKPMTTPAGYEEFQFAELSICLPPEWKISEEDFEDENNYWPIRWLKILALFPHKYNSWLGYGHTIPNGDPAEPFAPNTQMNTILLLPTIVFDETFHTLTLESKTIHFYTMIPLYTEEVNLKLKEGTEALFDGFDKYGVSDILEVDRPNTTQRKKFLGLF